MKQLMLNKLKNSYYGFLVGVFVISVLMIFLLRENKLYFNIEVILNYNSKQINDNYYDNNKLKIILPKEILTNDNNFIKDINKTLNYVATVIDGRYVSNPNLTAYKKLNYILTQNEGGGFVVIWL
jgi:hypothetical protein